jgi:hypothetical protein
MYNSPEHRPPVPGQYRGGVFGSARQNFSQPAPNQEQQLINLNSGEKHPKQPVHNMVEITVTTKNVNFVPLCITEYARR